MAVVLGPYVVATIFSALVASKRSIKTVILLPIVFACRHIAYGVGFLAGLWRRKAFQPNGAAVPPLRILLTQSHNYLETYNNLKTINESALIKSIEVETRFYDQGFLRKDLSA